MSRFGRNAVVALLGSMAIAGLVAPGLAGAAPKGVKIQLCNKATKELGANVSGLNVNRQWVTIGPPFTIKPNGPCLEVRDHSGQPSKEVFWAKNQWVQLDIFSGTRRSKATCHLRANLADGVTQTCNILRAP